jgi:hypothetical protein
LQTQKLTRSLGSISGQVQAVIPIINKISESNEEIPSELVNYLNVELGHLEDINKRLLYETGLDADNPDESIWKSPSRKLEVEEQIEELSKIMTTQMKHMQSMLIRTMDQLNKRLEHEKNRKDESGNGKG